MPWKMLAQLDDEQENLRLSQQCCASLHSRARDMERVDRSWKKCPLPRQTRSDSQQSEIIFVTIALVRFPANPASRLCRTRAPYGLQRPQVPLCCTQSPPTIRIVCICSRPHTPPVACNSCGSRCVKRPNASGVHSLLACVRTRHFPSVDAVQWHRCGQRRNERASTSSICRAHESCVLRLGSACVWKETCAFSLEKSALSRCRRSATYTTHTEPSHTDIG